MRAIFTLLIKEFRQVLRDPMIMRIIFILPIIQLFVLAYAATLDLRHVEVSVFDQDLSAESRALQDALFHSAEDLFVQGPVAQTPEQLQDYLERRKADVAIWIPDGFADALAEGDAAELGIQVDGRNSNMAGRAAGHVQGVLRQFSEEIAEERMLANPAISASLPPQVSAISRVYFNPELRSRAYMVPGIIVLLVTIVSGMLTGMAIVREKEIGTLEQLMVTPITSVQLIIGKTVPFAVLAFLEMAAATVIALLWFKIPLNGSPLLLAGTGLLYLLVTLGVGLFASTVSRTQQQAMFVVWFFLVFGILMSGFFFPVENMPDSVELLTYLNPMRYFMTVIRGIFLKGAGAADLAFEIGALATLGVVVFGAAGLRFSKRVD